MPGSLTKAFFLDIPFLIDSAWRHTEYTLSAECNYPPGPNPKITLRRFWRKPPFWFFAVTVFFVSYGPTWGGLCAIAPQYWTDLAREILGVLIVIGSPIAVVFFLGPWVTGLIMRRFANGQHMPFWRRGPVVAFAWIALLLVTAVAMGAGSYLYGPVSGDGSCAVESGSSIARWQLGICAAAIVVFAFIMALKPSVKWSVTAQGVILSVVALIQFFVLAGPLTLEACDLPYRHVFTFLAPCIVAIVAVAPWIAGRVFQGNSGVPEAARGRFRQLLSQTELFVNRDDPELSKRRIFHALVFGPMYQPLHLLLFPSLMALVAPVNRLYLYVFLAFVFSFFLLVWGNVSPRWQELNTYIKRWFLRGTPLLISLFVIVIATLRLVQFDYVSTILDAVPFGTVFGLVVMNYVLFWLVEYWMSRVAAGELLSVLGPTTDEVRIPYEPTFQQPNQNQPVRVKRDGRFLVSHGTGRFVAVGTVGPLDGPVYPPQPVRAFQTYYLMELFSRLGNGTGDPQHDVDVADINERTGIYFFWLNSLLFLVMMGFLTFVVVEHYTNNAIDPVVTVQATQPPERLVDLSSPLRQQEGEPVRPAIVVVSSGGGTRAALYTASVLYGLHRLGVDRDIVLVSGVSGGGVALAYFAANRNVLTEQSQSGQAGHCPDKADVKRSVEDEWDCFSKGVTQPFIEDVLSGATEWRIFRTTALSKLLAESFERHLFPPRDTLGSFNTPALILNSTVVSQPADESDALMRTIDPAKTCEEAERTFNLMAGGRLIFTNLRDTHAFPQRAATIPDVRLPYEIVQDPHIPLASAAALNADFPPVFPTARVRIRNEAAGACPYRSYYVTDGGAEENVGLISALYALKGALAGIPNGVRVRPIHLVIAEASAITYDYSQDRGVSALFGGSSERLAGGLTNTLNEQVIEQLRRLSSAQSSIRFHYLGLPLAFRARGGFGTHWMYAKVYHLNDPRPRTTAWTNYLPFTRFREGKAAVSREELEELWLSLHDPDHPFCDHGTFNSNDADKVKTWICGSSQDGPNGRDLHMENWKELVDELRPHRGP